jgi:hypothetical protein
MISVTFFLLLFSTIFFYFISVFFSYYPNPRGQAPFYASNPPERILWPTHSRKATAVAACTADSNAPTRVAPH